MRRGWVCPMRPSIPRPSSRQIFGSCVVLPDPVSPHTMTTGCEAMAFAISSRFAQIGSSGGNSGRGASARRCSISAGENAIRGGRRCRSRRSSAAQQAFRVACERVHFQVDAFARPKTPQRGHGEGMRDQVDLELGAPHRVHREAHAVHGDRTLARDVARESGRCAHAKQPVFAHRFEAHDLPDAVDVTENEVAVEPVGEPPRLLQVDLSRFVQPGGAAQSLAGNIDAEAFSSALHHGETHAVHRDAVADLDVAEPQLVGVDGEAQTAFSGLDPADFPDGGYDSGKHRREFYLALPGESPRRTRVGWTSGGRMTKTAPIPISGLAHIGIRVHDLERSVRFYALLGFTKTAGPIGPEPVAILDHPSGVELNLVLNAPSANEPNVLMDVPDKHPGITHFALLCPDIMAAKERLEAAGIPLSGGPVRFGPGAQGIFVRDPDRNVIELHQRG